MEDEQAYREMGLTLPELAKHMQVPAYRLRETINRGLGYRNFNDFLNSYRIAEAAARLGNPAERDIQILVIALDAGFRSLSSFNKAFRAEFDATPTEYRRSRAGDLSE
jgi:AraC-like DNA-binding protein